VVDRSKAAWRFSGAGCAATVDERTDCVFANGLVAQRGCARATI
jgi:hypothetical protein